MSQVSLARHEWQEGSRRLEAARDDAHRYGQLLEFLGILLAELRRRVGQAYTLEDLAAAFDAYQRGALDYEP